MRRKTSSDPVCYLENNPNHTSAIPDNSRSQQSLPSINWNIIRSFKKNIDLFVFGHGLHCCSRAFSSCPTRGLFSNCSAPGFSLQWLPLLWNMGSRHMDFSSCVQGLHCSSACGILADWGRNLCLLHQVDSLPLSHQGSP